MRLSSRAFRDEAAIPSLHTCEGDDVSPPLSWEGVPPGTRSLALIVDDPDAPDPAAPRGTPWVHWVVIDLPPDTGGVDEGTLDGGGRVGKNDWRRTAWNGPCPPIGRHRYVFKLYALDRVLGLAQPSKVEVERAMTGHILAEARLIGTYERHRP